jgi:hypothetical protein
VSLGGVICGANLLCEFAADGSEGVSLVESSVEDRRSIVGRGHVTGTTCDDSFETETESAKESGL